MIRRPPRSTQSRSSAASDVYKRQVLDETDLVEKTGFVRVQLTCNREAVGKQLREQGVLQWINSRVRIGDAKRNVAILQGSVIVGDHEHMSTRRLDTLQNCYVEVETRVVRSLSLIHISEPT